jgi:hypothetical protein
MDTDRIATARFSRRVERSPANTIPPDPEPVPNPGPPGPLPPHPKPPSPEPVPTPPPPLDPQPLPQMYASPPVLDKSVMCSAASA